MITTFSDKFAPTTLDEIILLPELKETIQGFLSKKTIPHLLLAGKPGCGKNTLINIIVKVLDADVLFINASLDNGIDMVRTKVLEFTKSMSMNNRLKIVVLNEADSLTNNTNGSSAQDALRNIIDSSSDDTRFILTCNYISKISAPLQSRCTPINVKFDIKDILKLVIKILKTEKIEYTEASLGAFAEQTINKHFPDIRTILNRLELSCVKDKLFAIQTINCSELEKIATNIFEMITKKKHFQEIREYYIKQSDYIGEDWEILAGKIFDNFAENSHAENSQYENTLSIISDYIYRIAQVEINKEIQMAAMILKLRSMI